MFMYSYARSKKKQAALGFLANALGAGGAEREAREFTKGGLVKGGLATLLCYYNAYTLLCYYNAATMLYTLVATLVKGATIMLLLLDPPFTKPPLCALSRGRRRLRGRRQGQGGPGRICEVCVCMYIYIYIY